MANEDFSGKNIFEIIKLIESGDIEQETQGQDGGFKSIIPESYAISRGFQSVEDMKKNLGFESVSDMFNYISGLTKTVGEGVVGTTSQAALDIASQVLPVQEAGNVLSGEGSPLDALTLGFMMGPGKFMPKNMISKMFGKTKLNAFKKQVNVDPTTKFSRKKFLNTADKKISKTNKDVSDHKKWQKFVNEDKVLNKFGGTLDDKFKQMSPTQINNFIARLEKQGLKPSKSFKDALGRNYYQSKLNQYNDILDFPVGSPKKDLYGNFIQQQWQKVKPGPIRNLLGRQSSFDQYARGFSNISPFGEQPVLTKLAKLYGWGEAANLAQIPSAMQKIGNLGEGPFLDAMHGLGTWGEEGTLSPSLINTLQEAMGLDWGDERKVHLSDVPVVNEKGEEISKVNKQYYPSEAINRGRADSLLNVKFLDKIGL